MLTLLPLFILVAGAGLLLLGLNPRFAQTWLVSIAAAGAALIALLAAAFFLPTSAVFSAWAPPALFPAGLSLSIDPLAWLSGMAIVGLELATLLTSLARPGGRRISVRGATLLLTAAGLAAVFADNLPTRIIAWAGLDLIYFLILVFLVRSEGLELQAVLNLAFNSAGTLLAVAAGLLISRTSATLSLRDAAVSPQSTALLTLAAMFRLGLFPLHLGLPAEANIRQGLGTMLRLIPAAVALELVGRLAVFGFAASLRPWLTLFAVLAALAGAGQLWNIPEPRLGLTYIVVAQSGFALLAGLWGGAQAVPALTGFSLALILGGGLLYLSPDGNAQQPLTFVPRLLGVAALLGLPLTAGAAGTSGLVSGLMANGQWLALAVLALAWVVLAAGLWRTAFWQTEPGEVEPLASLLSGAGVAWLSAGVLGLGLFAGAVAVALNAPAPTVFGGPQITGLVTALAVTAAGFGFWRLEGIARSGAALASLPLLVIARLDWLYRLVWGALGVFGALVHGLAEVIEGEGALLWVLVTGLLVWLALR